MNQSSVKRLILTRHAARTREQVKENVPLLKAENPTMTHGECMKQVGQRWRQLSKNERESWCRDPPAKKAKEGNKTVNNNPQPPRQASCISSESLSSSVHPSSLPPVGSYGFQDHKHHEGTIPAMPALHSHMGTPVSTQGLDPQFCGLYCGLEDCRGRSANASLEPPPPPPHRVEVSGTVAPMHDVLTAGLSFWDSRADTTQPTPEMRQRPPSTFLDLFALTQHERTGFLRKAQRPPPPNLHAIWGHPLVTSDSQPSRSRASSPVKT